MKAVNASKLRNNLFEFLDRVSKGESVTIRRNGEDVAVMKPIQKEDWRDQISVKLKLTVPPDQTFAPMEDTWKDYI